MSEGTLILPHIPPETIASIWEYLGIDSLLTTRLLSRSVCLLSTQLLQERTKPNFFREIEVERHRTGDGGVHDNVAIGFGPGYPGPTLVPDDLLRYVVSNSHSDRGLIVFVPRGSNWVRFGVIVESGRMARGLPRTRMRSSVEIKHLDTEETINCIVEMTHLFGSIAGITKDIRRMRLGMLPNDRDSWKYGRRPESISVLFIGNIREVGSDRKTTFRVPYAC